MRYLKFGKLDWEASVLGFGAMRLPLTSKNPADVDEAESIRMIRYAIDHGVNYVDTAYLYHQGQGEPTVGRALQHGYRQKVKLATKLPFWLVSSLEDCDRCLDEQLKRLQTDHVDFYLLHGMNKEWWPRLRDLGVLRWAEKAMAHGRIGYLGFSFHDDFEVFKDIVDSYDNWTLCQIQYNYMDIAYQAGIKGLRYASEKGLAVVIMEPLRGGQLSKEPPAEVARLWARARQKRTPAEWALQWVWNHLEVSLVLSGMTAMEHVVENIAIANRSGPGTLPADELRLIDQVREAYRKLSPVPCTNCGYCMPCPQGVLISTIFELYNDAIVYNDLANPRFTYRIQLQDGQRADQCAECKECILICPQRIQIPKWLQKAHALLGTKPKPPSTDKGS
jgi:hypothetical protein